MSEVELDTLEKALLELQEENKNEFVSLFKLKKKLKEIMGKRIITKPLMKVLEPFEEFDVDEQRRMVAFSSSHFDLMKDPNRDKKTKPKFQFRFLKKRFRAHEHRIHTVLFCGDPIKYMVTSSADKTIKIWKYRTLYCLHEITEHKNVVNQVIEWEKGKSCMSCSFGKYILQFSLKKPFEITRRILTPVTSGVFALAKLSKDLLLYAGMDELIIYRLSSESIIKRSMNVSPKFQQAFSTTTQIIPSKTFLGTTSTSNRQEEEEEEEEREEHAVVMKKREKKYDEEEEEGEGEEEEVTSLFFNPIPSTDISQSYVGILYPKDFSTRRLCSCMSGKYCVFMNEMGEEMVVVGDNNSEKPVVKVFNATVSITEHRRGLYRGGDNIAPIHTFNLVRSNTPITSMICLNNEHLCISITNGEMFCYDILEDFKKNGYFAPSFERSNHKLKFVFHSSGTFRVACRDNMGLISIFDMSVLDLTNVDDMMLMHQMDHKERSEYIQDEDGEEMEPAFIEIRCARSRPLYLLRSLVAFD